LAAVAGDAMMHHCEVETLWLCGHRLLLPTSHYNSNSHSYIVDKTGDGVSSEGGDKMADEQSIAGVVSFT